MKIGFDARYAEGDLVGIGNYIKSLVTRFDQKGIECLLFYTHKPKFPISGKNIKSVVLGNKNRYIFEQFLLPVALVREKVDLYHALGNVGIPLFCPVPAILTVHDIIPLEIKDYFSYSPLPFVSRTSYMSRLKLSLFKAKKIVAVSNFTSSELHNKLGISKSKIVTILNGSPILPKAGKLPKNLQGKDYILDHGGIDIRKNLHKLIEAFLFVNSKYPDLKLVITGDHPKFKVAIDRLIQKLDLKDKVIFTGYLKEEILTSVIKNAKLICYPTLAEGFGFPILEGFSAKIPVISSDIPVIREVAGDGALLINPNDPKIIADAISEVIEKPNLANSMVQKGSLQYNKFSWERCTDEYLHLYNSI